MTLRMSISVLSSLLLLSSAALADEHAHFDIAPYFQDSRLLTGGLDHKGNHTAPPVSVYGYEFGEDPADPFNPSDPGVNQAAGVGNLPAGAQVRFNILSSLRYWNGSGEVDFSSPPGNAYANLSVGATSCMLTDSSGPQTGGLVQSVASDGSVHKHFTTSLFHSPGTLNVPGETGYVAPLTGIYAFRMELTLTHNSTLYASDPFWIVFNHGASEDAHHEAMESLVPEPSSALVVLGGVALAGLRRRRGRH